MTIRERQRALEAFVEQWIASVETHDADAAARLRADGYSLRLPDGSRIGAAEELSLIRNGAVGSVRLHMEGKWIVLAPDGEAAKVDLELDVEMEDAGDGESGRYRCALDVSRRSGEWQALAARIDSLAPGGVWHEQAQRPIAARVLRRALARLKGFRSRMPAKPRFQNSAYIPYRPGESFLLPPSRALEGALPIPPEHLWLGYNYPAHGKSHVATMLAAVERSGLALAPGDRILDLGCGAGRMIRHLEHLAGECEIWGADISAEHIFWCKQHLSPPFNFATTTKVPSLPFEDRSFALIYCGSLFTHIDDMADAWLLELHRILSPGGRLYITIHDEHTMKLFDEPSYGWSQIVRSIKAQPLFAQARGGFGMLALGRDDQSQVFYERSFFRAMTDRMFDTLATIEEGYFYQTALVLARRPDRAARAPG